MYKEKDTITNGTALKFNKKSIPCVLILIGILIPSGIRRVIIPGRLGEINLLFVVATIILLLRLISYKLKRMEVLFLLCASAMLGICFVSNWKYGYSISFNLFTLLFTSLPLYLLCCRKRISIDKNVLRTAFKIFNVLVVLIVLIGIFNRLGGNAFNALVLKLLSIEHDQDTYYRLWSFYGHPLYNSFLILVYYSLNYLVCKNAEKIKKIKKPSMVFVSIISLIGVILGESKAAILVFLLLLIFLNFKSIRFLVFEVIIVISSYLAGLFDFFMQRISQTSFSSRRFENYAFLVQQSYFKKYMFFYGYGTNFEREYYKDRFYAATAAYEIPVLSLMLDYGIFYTILFLIATVIYPTVLFIKRKQYDFLICWVAVSAFINTFNAIVILNDYLFIYIFLECLFIYLSDSWVSCENKSTKVY